MSVLKIIFDPDNDFCVLSFPYNRRFQDLLKVGIRPISHRRYDRLLKKWSVHINKIPRVVSWGRRHFSYVDYSTLPTSIQVMIAAQKGTFSFDADNSTPHQVLFLRDDAPLVVVKASYKALAVLAHPDGGGTVEAFRELDEAYKTILEGFTK